MSANKRVVRKDEPSIDQFDHWYSTTTYCGNCGDHDYAYVRKGVKKKGLSVTCDKCGCQVDL